MPATGRERFSGIFRFTISLVVLLSSVEDTNALAFLLPVAAAAAAAAAPAISVAADEWSLLFAVPLFPLLFVGDELDIATVVTSSPGKDTQTLVIGSLAVISPVVTYRWNGGALQRRQSGHFRRRCFLLQQVITRVQPCSYLHKYYMYSKEHIFEDSKKICMYVQNFRIIKVSYVIRGIPPYSGEINHPSRKEQNNGSRYFRSQIAAWLVGGYCGFFVHNFLSRAYRTIS